jgi:hypothetical protein
MHCCIYLQTNGTELVRRWKRKRVLVRRLRAIVGWRVRDERVRASVRRDELTAVALGDEEVVAGAEQQTSRCLDRRAYDVARCVIRVVALKHRSDDRQHLDCRPIVVGSIVVIDIVVVVVAVAVAHVSTKAFDADRQMLSSTR